MENLLTKDGVVEYYGKVMEAARANHFMEKMMEEIAWRNDEAFIMGKHFITKRKVAWYGEKPFEYAYSGTVKRALPWTPALAELKLLAEQRSGDAYNSCLLNLYHDGSEGMAWHSDGEKDLKRDGAIASLSFGAERKFCFKHKGDGMRIDVWLEDGSLLVMKGATQRHWLHRLPPTKKINSPRINLTFRTILD